MLDLLYLPIFKPDEKQVKFMKFTKEIAEYFKNDVIPCIQTKPNQEGEFLETTPNQMQFIGENTSKHIDIGLLNATKGWLDQVETPKDHIDALQFNSSSLRFVDLLTLNQEQA